MRQHSNSWRFRLDLFDGRELLHVSDAVDDGVNLPPEDVSVRELAFGTADFDFPSGIEEVYIG